VLGDHRFVAPLLRQSRHGSRAADRDLGADAHRGIAIMLGMHVTNALIGVIVPVIVASLLAGKVDRLSCSNHEGTTGRRVCSN
jgi:hypothetical protein